MPHIDEESTTQDNSVVTERLYVISSDIKHDSHSVHKCRELVCGYLKDIGYKSRSHARVDQWLLGAIQDPSLPSGTFSKRPTQKVRKMELAQT